MKRILFFLTFLPLFAFARPVRVTIYNAAPSQCWGDATITSDGSHIDFEALERFTLRWCAVSHNLKPLYPPGTALFVNLGYANPLTGFWEVHDTMNSRFVDYIDLLIPRRLNRSIGGLFSGHVTPLRSTEYTFSQSFSNSIYD